jgi:hypothetical protein
MCFLAHLDIYDLDAEKLRGHYICAERKLIRIECHRHADAMWVASRIGEQEFPGKIIVVHAIKPYDGQPITELKTEFA